jgi:hypothetical protein
VVKVLDLGETTSFGHDGSFNLPAREIGAYKSGFLERIDGRVRAAPCYGVTTIGDTTLLWMADLSDTEPHPWTGEQFLAASRHVGYFNGSWPDSNAPNEVWLDRKLTTNRLLFGTRVGWLKPIADPANEGNLRDLTSLSGVSELTSMPSVIDLVGGALERLPRVVCHNDLHSRNAFFRYEPDGPTIYAIDWASVGVGPVGVDGGTLAGGGGRWSRQEAELAAELEGRMFLEYLEGLKDAGYSFDRREVRLGFLSNQLPHLLSMIVAVAQGPQSWMYQEFLRRFQLEGDEFLGEAAVRVRMFKPLLDEASALARQLG